MFTMLLVAGVAFTIIPFKYSYKEYYGLEQMNGYYRNDRIPINFGCGVALDILGFFGFIMSCVLYHINKKTPEDYKDYAQLSYQKKYQAVFILSYAMFFIFTIAGVVLCALPFHYTQFSYYLIEQNQKQQIEHDILTKSLQLHLGSGVFQVVVGFFGLLILQQLQQYLNTPISQQLERNDIKKNDEQNNQNNCSKQKSKSSVNKNQEPESIMLYENKYYERRCSNILDSIEIIDNLNVTRIGTSQVE
ncbi:Hypothetical_protein [Hexamita inflata]|uniref:Hypothetical_protein n=1 Tax=Hexamita inflata TaxID=28002 RepID=A0AA86NAY5_9EUKA|nr:Hypothetical protein HINF_LOCUS3501 [Hexamita inflata]